MRIIASTLFSVSALWAQTHPRIFLDAITLSSIRARYSSNTVEWQQLKAQCDAYLTYPVVAQRPLVERYSWSTSTKEVTPGHIAVGYQGGAAGPNFSAYYDAVYNLGLCYQATLAAEPTLSSAYGAQLVAIANVLSVEPARMAGPPTVRATDLAIDSNDGTRVTSTSHSFDMGDVGKTIVITSGTGFIPGNYEIVNYSGVSAILSTAIGTVGSTGGSYTLRPTYYVADSAWQAGTAWQVGATIKGAQITAGSVSLTGLKASSTILAGDSFVVNGTYFFTVSSNTSTDAGGDATVTIGTSQSGQNSGTLPTTSYLGSLTEGWPVTREVVLSVTPPPGSVKTGDSVITYNGSGADGTWTVSALDGSHYLLERSICSSTPLVNQVWDPATNNTYGIRNFGPTLALLYDWGFALLDNTQRRGLSNAILHWLFYANQFNKNSFGLDAPGGNYFLGINDAWVLGTLAIDQEVPFALTYYNYWLTTYFNAPRGIADFYGTYLTDYWHGDTAYDGYGQFSVIALLEIVKAMMTVNGYSPLADSSHPFLWGSGAAKWLVGNSRGDLTGLNPRGINQTNVNQPGPREDFTRNGIQAIAELQNYLGRTGDPFLPYFTSYAASAITALRSSTGNSDENPNYFITLGRAFLNYDPKAAATDYKTLPLYYISNSAGEISWRSDWTSTGIWATFLAGPYLDYTGGSKDALDRGGFHIAKGLNQWLLPAAEHEIARYAIAPASYITLPGSPLPKLQNVLQVNHPAVNGVTQSQSWFGPGAIGVWGNSYDPVNAVKNNPSTLARSEATANYVYARGENLYYNYPIVDGCNIDFGPCGANRALLNWTRQIFNLIPRVFLVYDTSSVYNSSWDHWLAWHFQPTPTSVSAPQGLSRYDIDDAGSTMDGPAWKGTVYTILPAGRTECLAPLNAFGTCLSGNIPNAVYGGLPVLYRLEVHSPSGEGTNRWLTMFDLSPESKASYLPVHLNSTNADIVQLNDPNNSVIGFSQTLVPTLPIVYSFSGGAAAHYIAGMANSTPYHVTLFGSTVIIAAATGSANITSSAAGILTFHTPNYYLLRPGPPHRPMPRK